MNIDEPRNNLHNDDDSQKHTSLTVISSWHEVVMKTGLERDDTNENDYGETGDHSTPSNTIQVIFTIPFTISNDAILNQTVFITDAVHNQLLATITQMCINGSSIIINYSTNKPLPHNVCLYLVLNMTLSTTIREIFTCRTIGKNTSSHGDVTSADHTVEPSATFIISQGVIIFLMMFIIYLVHKAKDKHLIDRFSQHIFHMKPTGRTTSNSMLNNTNHIQLNNLISSPTEEQVSTTNDLSLTTDDRIRPNHTLINIKELTNRLST